MWEGKSDHFTLFKRCIRSRTGQRNNVRRGKGIHKEILKAFWLPREFKLSKLNICWIDLLLFLILFFISIFCEISNKQNSYSFWDQIFAFSISLKLICRVLFFLIGYTTQISLIPICLVITYNTVLCHCVHFLLYFFIQRLYWFLFVCFKIIFNFYYL